MESYFKIPVRYALQDKMHEDNPRVYFTPDVIENHNRSSPVGRLENYMVGNSILQHLPERDDIEYLPERDEHGYFGDNIQAAPKRKIPTRRR